MPTITRNITLKHCLTKSDEPEEVELAGGDEVSIIKEWEDHFLVRAGDGKVFNVKKEFVDAGS